MQRDMDLCPAILVALEDMDRTTSADVLKIDGVDDERVLGTVMSFSTGTNTASGRYR